MSGKVILSRGREKSLRRHHPWVFSGAVASSSGRLSPGATVDVFSSDGEWLARGAWSPASQIRVRIWTFRQDEAIDHAFFKRRIMQALELRRLLPELAGCDASRMVAAESDGLPGITVDRYGDILVVQLLSAGADFHRERILEALAAICPDCRVMERSDAAVLKKEGLQPTIKAYSENMPEVVEITEQGLKFNADLRSGHKTGHYLDQRVNRTKLAVYAGHGTVLNCFCYTGAMGVYCLMAGATHVTQVDMSAEALALARHHLQINGLDESRSDFVQADVFKLLREYREQGRKFDMIILDPPKFVESRASLERACRGYKDINMMAMQLLSANGILGTFSCSGLMPEDLFRKVVADAALDAGREVQYLEFLRQAGDHPVSAAFPEGLYLKGLICRVI